MGRRCAGGGSLAKRAARRDANGRLLHRTTRRQSLTELGRRYYARCVEILALVEAAELDAHEMQASPRGQLRVSCPVIYGTRALVPVLAGYLDRYPDVQVELSLDDRFVDLAADGFDAAIRIGELPDSGLIARPLRPSPRVACASPAYLARHGTPQVPAELVQHNGLALLLATGPEREWCFPRPDGQGVERVIVRGRLDVNSGKRQRSGRLFAGSRNARSRRGKSPMPEPGMREKMAELVLRHFFSE